MAALTKFDEELREMRDNRIALSKAEDTFYSTALTRKNDPNFQNELKEYNAKMKRFYQ